MIYIFKTLKRFPMYNIGCYQPVLLYSPSLALGNCNSVTGKWGDSAQCRTELDKGKNRLMVVHHPCVEA